MRVNDTAKPFIKKFSDEGFFYIYDVNTNQVVEVEKTVYDIIDEYQYKDKNTPGLKQSLEEIENARAEHGLFSNFRPKKVTLGLRTADAVKKLHEKGLKQLILELTRGCNLNCGYCSTAGKYSGPDTSQIHMTREQCRKAVDFFCQRNGDIQQSFITFYGGEPLLRLDLIKYTVQYVKKKRGGEKYSFNLTTNGTLLNKENLDFFIGNDFFLMVSLDGPETVNDRYRRFKNGKGTFKSILKN
ncbi:MAG: radical SAM protein, partial [bacterium]|nr:radical SAM protein [bacterium]